MEVTLSQPSESPFPLVHPLFQGTGPGLIQPLRFRHLKHTFLPLLDPTTNQPRSAVGSFPKCLWDPSPPLHCHCRPPRPGSHHAPSSASLSPVSLFPILHRVAALKSPGCTLNPVPPCLESGPRSWSLRSPTNYIFSGSSPPPELSPRSFTPHPSLGPSQPQWKVSPGLCGYL